MLDGEPRQSRRPRARAAEEEDRSAGQGWRGGDALTLADFTRSIALMETVSRVEEDVEGTLRAMAARDKGTVAARRLSLAEDAARGARTAAEHCERLRQQARQWAEHSDVAALRQALDHAGTVLADLARAENDIAGILNHLASRDGSDLGARRQRLAAQASAAAEHARDLAQALHRLAETDMASTQPDRAPAACTVDGGAALESAFHQRQVDIDRRLAELQLARPKPPGDDPAPQAGQDAQRCAREAQQHSQDALTHLLQVRQLTAEILDRAASAHDRAAEANARSAAAGIGDVAEHSRMAAHHRAAAQADRERAQKARILSAQALEATQELQQA